MISNNSNQDGVTFSPANQSDITDVFPSLSTNDIQKTTEENIRFKIQEFSRDYLYKLFNISLAFIGGLVVAVVIGMITYNNYMNDKLQDTYKIAYSVKGDFLLLRYQKEELEERISKLEQEIAALKEENIILRRQQSRGESK